MVELNVQPIDEKLLQQKREQLNHAIEQEQQNKKYRVRNLDDSEDDWDENVDDLIKEQLIEMTGALDDKRCKNGKKPKQIQEDEDDQMPHEGEEIK